MCERGSVNDKHTRHTHTHTITHPHLTSPVTRRHCNDQCLLEEQQRYLSSQAGRMSRIQPSDKAALHLRSLLGRAATAKGKPLIRDIKCVSCLLCVCVCVSCLVCVCRVSCVCVVCFVVNVCCLISTTNQTRTHTHAHNLQFPSFLPPPFFSHCHVGRCCPL